MAKQVHVVVVNHQEAFLRLMETILVGQGYKATVCAASEETHQLISNAQPDVIVVDTWLQRRDQGWELLQILRLDEATRRIPIILASSDAERIRDRAGEISALKNVLLVSKPFDPETLVRAVERITNASNRWDTEAQAALDLPPLLPQQKAD